MGHKKANRFFKKLKISAEKLKIWELLLRDWELLLLFSLQWSLKRTQQMLIRITSFWGIQLWSNVKFQAL